METTNLPGPREVPRGDGHDDPHSDSPKARGHCDSVGGHWPLCPILVVLPLVPGAKVPQLQVSLASPEVRLQPWKGKDRPLSFCGDPDGGKIRISGETSSWTWFE